MRNNLLYFSWADYMNMDIESVIDEIERKAKKEFGSDGDKETHTQGFRGLA